MLTLATKFVPVESAFQTASDAGFTAAEFWLDGKLLANVDEICQVAAKFPFRYALHFPNGGPLTDQSLEACVAMYRKLQCTALIIHQPMFNRYGKALNEIGAIDQAIENHVLDLPGFERWAETNPGLTLDVEHLWKFTLHDAPLSTLLEQFDRFLERHAGKLQHVHLPGYVPGADEHRPIFHSDEMATEVMNRLAAHGFTKLVVSEADTEFQTLEILRDDAKWFQNWKLSHAA